jgi:uncharacterized membrane protein
VPSGRAALLIAALIVLVAFVQLGVIGIAFERLGLDERSAYLLLMTTLFGSLINLPLFSVRAKAAVEEFPPERLRRMFGLPKQPFTGRTIVAVNVGGALTPVAFCIYLITHTPLGFAEVATAVGAVTLVAYLTSTPIPGVGIGMPFLVAPLTAAATAMLINPAHAAPLAYIGGTLGVLIGADLLRLGSIRKLGAPVAAVGGAGTFDGIFLTGILAVLLA